MAIGMEPVHRNADASPMPSAPVLHHVNAPGPVVHQPVGMSRGNVNQQRPTRNWKEGICGCQADPISCFMTFFFFPCYLCYISDKMGEGCCMACWTPYGVSLAMLRLKLRLTENIKGDMLDDYCCSCWSPMCVLCQLKREMDSIGHYT